MIGQINSIKSIKLKRYPVFATEVTDMNDIKK
jgi:hypothetical protein